jgi:hypothetical protein
MQKTRYIAFLLLVAFTANFTVFCHCATARKQSCCCEKTEKKSPCHSAQAVKFNLVEKQLADQIQAAPIPVVERVILQPVVEAPRLPVAATPDQVHHPPPDILTLQHRLLI